MDVRLILQTAFALRSMSITQTVLICGAVLGLTLVIWSVGRKSGLHRMFRKEPRGPAGATSAVVRDVEQIIVELERVSRQVHAKLDAKIAKLEGAIGAADERIEALSRVQRTVDSGLGLDVTLAAQPPEPSDDSAYTKTRQDHSVVYRLADGGFALAQIAEEVGRTIGEIELILALRRTRSAGVEGAALSARTRP